MENTPSNVHYIDQVAHVAQLWFARSSVAMSSACIDLAACPPCCRNSSGCGPPLTLLRQRVVWRREPKELER
eukprot:3670755-Amphidinium_carterae.1